MTDSEVLSDAIVVLLSAFEQIVGAEPAYVERTIVPWIHILDLAYEAVLYPGTTVAVWREVASLSDDEKRELLSAAQPRGRD